MEIVQTEDFTVEIYEIIENTNSQSGIYCIYNIVSGKQYIGSAINFSQRIRNHKSQLSKIKHHNAHMQSAWNNYGDDSFIFLIVEYCSIENLIKREQFWLEQFDFSKQLYNICPTAGSHLGMKRSDKSRKKMSESQKGRVVSEKTRLKLSEANNGRKHTEEHKRKCSEARIGRKCTEETRKKISEANKGRVMSEETKLKLLEANKGRKLTEEHKNKLSQLRKGRKFSEEHKRKMSESAKKRCLRGKNQ